MSVTQHGVTYNTTLSFPKQNFRLRAVSNSTKSLISRVSPRKGIYLQNHFSLLIREGPRWVSFMRKKHTKTCDTAPLSLSTTNVKCSTVYSRLLQQIIVQKLIYSYSDVVYEHRSFFHLAVNLFSIASFCLMDLFNIKISFDFQNWTIRNWTFQKTLIVVMSLCVY